MRKGKSIVIGCIGGVIAIVVVVLLLALKGNRVLVVGKDIAADDITEFWYTRASSAYPPDYQRYRFYTEKGAYRFCHEKREGTSWPLTEADITLSGTVELSEEEWSEVLTYLNGGTVTKKVENRSAGGSGPWLYLYWQGDRSKYREFSFSSFSTQSAFEKFCAELTMRGE